MTLRQRHSFVLLLAFGMLMVSCRGQLSDKPPVQPQQNMFFQERFNAQQENPFFEDRMAMRPPVEGTVARGQLREDVAFYEGLDGDGEYVTDNPVPLSSDLLHLGRERYDIFCSVCHGGTGDGQGIIMVGEYGYVPAPTFHMDRIREMSDGEIYSAIYRGVRNMPAYSHQVGPKESWAIVAYIRALQMSQSTPAELVAELGEDPDALMEAALAVAEEIDEPKEPSDPDDGPEISADRGEQLFTRQGCQACHSTDGTGGIGPTVAGLYGVEREMDDGTTVIADEEYLYESIVDPAALIVAGYQNMMMPYAHLSDDEVYSLVEYIKSLAD